MKKRYRIFFLFILVYFSTICWIDSGGGVCAKNKNIDSLLILLKKDKPDTSKVNHLNKLTGEYVTIGLYDSAFNICNSAFQLAQQLNFKKGIANSYGNIGIVYYYKGDYSKTLDYWLKALKIAEGLKDKVGIAKLLSNIGGLYSDQCDYTKALEYYFKGLKVGEELGNKNQIAPVIGNIGIVYRNLGVYTKALDFDFRALKMYEALGNKNGISNTLCNIGILYKTQRDYPKALDYYFKALKIDEELKKKNGIARILGSIGKVYLEQANEPLISSNRKRKLYFESEKYLLDAVKIDREIGALNDLWRFEESLASFYSKINQYKLAFKYYKNAMVLKDTIFSQENKKELVRKEMNYEFDKKEAITKAENEKQQAIAEEKNRRQKIITWSFAFGLLLVILFAGFILRSLRITRKQKNIIELQKNEVFQQKEIVEKQKLLVEEHQKEIIDSITYAKRLQEAILPPPAFVNEFLQNNFILYKPKDIVAGDFYWMEVVKSFEPGQGDVIFIAAADCTGHGVPGAMVSMVCSNALNRAVKEFHLLDTGKILDKATDLVLETFEKSDKDVKDGMDISLLRIEFVYSASGRKIAGLQWSGANNPLWYISPSSTIESCAEISEIGPDKQPIGKKDNRKPFTTHSIERSTLNLKSESVFYLFTDGYADQFGGSKGKKFMYKQFKELLLSIHHLPMNEQQNILEKTINDWRSNLEQVDDILVIGIRV